MSIGAELTTQVVPGASSPSVRQPGTQRTIALAASKDLWPLALWALYFVLKPFYFFDSGMPQIADYLVAALVFLTFISRQLTLQRSLIPILSALTVLILYFVLVDVLWAYISGETEMLLYAFYYLFNLLGCFAFACCYSRFGVRFLNWTAAATFASVCIQMLLSTEVLGRHESRATIYFNNPNQLGYYAILFGSIFWIWTQSLAKRSTHFFVMELVFYGSMLYLSCLTLSRAALASAGVLLLLRMAMRSRMTITLLAVACYFAISASNIEIIESFKQRLEGKNIGTEEELLHRGYDRLIDESQYLLFGAGEGAHWRFWGDYKIELHSSIGTVLFCYGAIGLLLFLRVYWVVGKESGWLAFVYLIPVSLYGLTHNGLRQLEFWIIMLLVVAIMQKKNGGTAIRKKDRFQHTNKSLSHA